MRNSLGAISGRSLPVPFPLRFLFASQPKIMGKVLNNVPIPSHERDDDYYYATEELP